MLYNRMRQQYTHTQCHVIEAQRLHFFVLVYNLFECLHSVSPMPKETANPCVGDTDNSQKGHIADIQFMSHLCI